MPLPPLGTMPACAAGRCRGRDDRETLKA